MVGRRQKGSSLLPHSQSSVSPPEGEGLGRGISPRGAILESRQTGVQTESRTHLVWKVSQVSTGESGFCRQFSDFLLATPHCCPLPPAGSHPSINPVQPWIFAQCFRGLDSPRRAEFPGSRTSCVPRGVISTEGRFGPVAKSKALMSSNCVGTCGGSGRRQMVDQEVRAHRLCYRRERIGLYRPVCMIGIVAVGFIFSYREGIPMKVSLNFKVNI